MSSNMNVKNFRYDINGLRAWAVLTVILYHFGVPWFGGGFIGVDVFFVISGFLMTGIIVNGLDRQSSGKGNFSIISFYWARAKRIIPALLALCLTLMVLGWSFLPSPDYRMFAVHAISALGFFSNIKFWTEAGYFDASSHDKLLLHTWSLSVEWQFYLILPVALWAIWKIRPGRNSITLMIGLGLAISLALSILLSPTKQSSSFYLLPTRAWEMLAGSLVYMLALRHALTENQRKAVEAAGFGLIVISVLLFDASSIWPGWRALVPVSGAVLVLIAARQSSLWTGTRVAQWLGSCSYSLYLWHWPLAVALAYLELQNNTAAIVVALALTLLLGQLSYSLIEKRTRFYLEKPSSRAGFSGLMATTAVMFLCLAIMTKEGVPGRMPGQVEEIFLEANNKHPRRTECHVGEKTPVPECTYGGNKLGVIVIGDSHAASIMGSVEKSLPSKSLHVLDWSLSMCPTLFGSKKTNDDKYRCGDFVSSALTRQKTLPTDAPLIIMNRTSSYVYGPNEYMQGETSKPSIYFTKTYTARTPEFLKEIRENIIDTACEFAKTRPVYIVRPIPEMRVDVPKTMGRALILGKDREVFITLEEYHARNDFVWEAQDAAKEKCGIKILDPLPYLCSDGRCNGAKDGTPLYFDDDHLSEHGGSVLTPMFAEVFKQSVSPLAQSQK